MEKVDVNTWTLKNPLSLDRAYWDVHNEKADTDKRIVERTSKHV